MRTAVVVAGGRSTRFGDGDKALTDLAGTPMIRRVADRLCDAVDSLVVNCRSDQLPAIRETMAGLPAPVEFAVDETPDRGPVAGVGTGLRAVDDEYAAVVACDLPFVDPDLVAHLFDRAASHDAAVPRLDGWLQATCAVYRTDAMADACEAALARGDRTLRATLDDLEYVVVEEPEVLEYASRNAFENLNTRAEFEAAADRL